MALKLGMLDKNKKHEEATGDSSQRKGRASGNKLPADRESEKGKGSDSSKETAEDAEKMDGLMKAIKAVRSVGNISGDPTPEELARQRTAHELVSKLAKPPVGVTRKRVSIDGIPAEWTSPDFTHTKRTIILYCHGGGYTCGGLGYAGILAGKLALYAGLKVLSFEYRLAPENPYPAALEDCMKVYDSLLYKGFGAGNIIVAGDSAGGNMALELVFALKEQGRLLPKALVLMSPWTDMTITASSYEKYKDLDPMLTKEYVLGVRKAYAGEDADFGLPQYSPLYGDLTGMPPTFIQVGSNEILRSDSERLYKKLSQNECQVKLAVYKGGWHVFQQLPVPRASKAMEDVKDFIWGLM